MFALVIVAVAVSGCGGSTKSAAGPQLTLGQYRAKANAICHAAARKAPPFPGKKSATGAVTTADFVIPYLRKIVRIYSDTARRLELLNAPASAKAKAARLVQAL